MSRFDVALNRQTTEQVKRALPSRSARMGRLVTVDPDSPACTVIFDGSSIPAPVKRWAHVQAEPGDRVGVQLFEKEWVVVGTLTVGEWQSYTPVWSASTPPSIGNGTISARFTRTGRTVTVSGRIQMGSTTTYGSGIWTVSLPIPAAVGTIGAGAAVLYRSGTAAARAAGACWLFDANAVRFVGSTGGDVTDAAPFAWTAGDQLRWTFTYETE